MLSIALSIELCLAGIAAHTEMAGLSFISQLVGVCVLATAVRANTTPLRPLVVYYAWKLFDMGWTVLADLPSTFSPIPPGGLDTTFIRLVADPEHRAAIVANEMNHCKRMRSAA